MAPHGAAYIVALVFLWGAGVRAQNPTGQAQVVQAIKVDAHGELADAPAAELAQPSAYRQVVIFPAGYTSAERGKFFEDARTMVRDMGNVPEAVYTRKYRDRLIYILQWLPGGALSSGNAVLGARLYRHPVRGNAGIALDNEKVVQAVEELKRIVPSVDPIAVMAIFNFNGPATANAVPPTLLQGNFGIARLTRRDIHLPPIRVKGQIGHYVPVHELAHAALNFLDEYIEPLMADADIRNIDPLTALLLPDGTPRGWRDAWGALTGDYDVRLSEILADNGNGHMSIRRTAATVRTSGFTPDLFEEEGGMIFGRGTFHDSGDNIMNGDFPNKREGNRFGWGHTPAQMRIIEQVFRADGKAPRPNDRLRAAGPLLSWLPQAGQRVRLLLFDGDKNHRWHPTQRYEVELSWKEDGVWWTQRRLVAPRPWLIDIKRSTAAAWAGTLRNVLLGMGIRRIPGSSGRSFDISSLTVPQLIDDLLPAARIPLPYQDVEVSAPAAQRMYYWRFRTYNGSFWSGWTAWSHFWRI